MTRASNLIVLLQRLCAMAQEVSEESFRVTFSGSRLRQDQATLIAEIGRELADVVPEERPVVRIDSETVAIDEVEQDESPWQFIVAKTRIAQLHRARVDEQTVLFLSEDALCNWVEGLDPLSDPQGYEPDFSRPVTFRVAGLERSFGGASLWVLPLSADCPDVSTESFLPDTEQVHGLVHVVTNGENVRIAPRGWALSWGDVRAPSAVAFARLSCVVLGACLAHELKRDGNNALTVVIRGGRTHRLGLWNSNSALKWRELMPKLIEAVEWVYAERSETRLKLIVDRLVLDLNDGECFLACLYRYLETALHQAKDSYDFVIMERKDAYLKEMRELMKDMKSQADLYAGKVRDLVSALVRDTLGVLVFIAFSFVGKFDPQRLHTVIDSAELALFLKALAAYLFLSMTLQLIVHYRDNQLSRQESQNWLNVLQNYTGSRDKRERFLAPLERRQTTLYFAMGISAFVYGVLMLAVLNLPLIVKGLS